MPHDDFENERDRIEHVLDILDGRTTASTPANTCH